MSDKGVGDAPPGTIDPREEASKGNGDDPAKTEEPEKEALANMQETDNENVKTEDKSKPDKTKNDTEPYEKDKEEPKNEEKIREQWMRMLKNQVTAATSAVTKRKNRILRLMITKENLHHVKTELGLYNSEQCQYHDCYEKFIDEFGDSEEQEREKETRRHEDKCITMLGFQTQVNNWIKLSDDELQDQLDAASNISKRSKNSKTSSVSTTSSKLREKAKLAELLVKQEQFEISQEIERMKLQMEIEQTQARAKVFQEDEPKLPTDIKPPPYKNQLDPLAQEYKPKTQCSQQPAHNRHGQRATHRDPGHSATKQMLTPKNDTEQQHQLLVSAMNLPQPEIEKFSGDPIDFLAFIIAFDTRIVPFTNNDNSRLYYLNQYLTSDPKEIISGCMYMPESEGYKTARSLLEKEYGEPYKVANAFLNKLQKWSTIKNDNSKDLKALAIFLSKCQNAMKGISHLTVLNHTPNLQMIIRKLPYYLQNKWRDHVTKIESSKQPAFSDIVKFIQKAADAATHPIYSKAAMEPNADIAKTAKKPAGSKSIFATNTQAVASSKCQLCDGPHDIEACSDFTNMTFDAKRKALFEKRLCFACFDPNHRSKDCKDKRKCNKCGKPHPTSLHEDNFIPRSKQNVNSGQSEIKADEVTTVTAHYCNESKSETIFQSILPVRVYLKGTNEHVNTYAFYDNGSTGCFVTESLAEMLDVKGTDVTLSLQTMNGIDIVNTKVFEGLIVTDVNGSNDIELPSTYSRLDIPVCHDQIPDRNVVKQWPHLASVASDIPQYNDAMQIGLLIGTNCPKALQPIEIIPTENNGPFAVRYRHGWTINGPLHVTVDSKGISCHRIMLSQVTCPHECVIPQQINEMFELDFENDKGSYPGEKGLSIEDEKFTDTAKTNIKFRSGHYELPLPFRDPNVKLPNNRPQAFSRAEWQRKKMLKNEKYHEDYVEFVEGLVKKGFAYRVPETEVAPLGPVFYLPHHAVYHPRKPEKIRVVFDASAKFQHVSLNDVLLQGPDLTNSLAGVLTRFREEKVAFMGDIASMFYQVHVPSNQHDYLRFLWWPNGDLNEPLQEYRMGVHIFGAVSSPSVANFALHTVADKAEVTHNKETATTIRRNFYVDDLLKSMPDEGQAVQLLNDVTSALQDGGFQLAKFASNRSAVLQGINASPACNLDYKNMQTERALGLMWYTESDSFGYSVNLKEKPTTRRGLLATTASLYDPLGLVSPFLLPAKRILQSTCNSELGWDDDIPEELAEEWLKWLNDLPKLENLKIPRCVKPSEFGDVTMYQLHVFSDASTTGYGAAIYLKIHDGHSYHSTLMLGKSRVAPKKATTIPRLELTAATVAVKLAQQLLQELDVPITSVTYYTDSTTVLHYLRNENKRFPIFVANRVRVIRDFSEVSQWRYIKSAENPADIASRGTSAKQLIGNRLWFEGPSFLRQQELPCTDEPPMTKTEDVFLTAPVVNNDVTPTQKLLCHYSSWHRLKKAVAVYRRMFNLMKDKSKDSAAAEPFHVEELEGAENAIIRYVQRQQFPNEVAMLSDVEESQVPKKQSPIYRLSPYMCEDGLLRVGGRLTAATLTHDMKHQVILPKKSHVTTLIIRQIHEDLAHSGRNHVLASSREKYWVIRANSTVRNVLFKCVQCRKLNSPVVEQKMADLPEDRVTPAPPFSFTGVDLFGPYYIKEGRKQLKRYGVLFTCLVSRAIHLETANTLETDSFLNALRRFISRRGNIKILRCDNATNFRGAERELKQCLDELQQNEIHEYLLKQKIQWKFNAPTASHQGGAWERQIRSVRKVLRPLLDKYGDRLDDESLRTLFTEVECIINSRPLTTISDSPDDLVPLSPDHLLKMKSAVTAPPPGNFGESDVYLRKRWRTVQYLANMFWSRWKREYLVTLQERQKWISPRRNISNGDIVLIKDDNLPRNQWAMARVIETHNDRRGFVRNVTVKTSTSVLERPVQKLVLLLENTE